jgi:hypothetical protein
MLLKLLLKVEMEGTLPNLFNKSSIIPLPKLDKDTTTTKKKTKDQYP